MDTPFYQIKVELVRMGPWKIESEVYRTFKLKGNQTLYDLHMNIQYAFDWDNDHMFSFYLGDELFDRDNEYSANPLGEHIISSFGKPTKSASKAQLRDLSITASSSFWYLFDYGDALVHKVTVEEIYEMMSEDKDLPTVINKIGDAPPQYPMQEE